MTEDTSTALRAPDPTLQAAEDDVVIAWSETPPVAHLHGCPDSSPVLQSIPAEAACWFAVPCRSCFPLAPEPGNDPCKLDDCSGVHNPHLAWQTAR